MKRGYRSILGSTKRNLYILLAILLALNALNGVATLANDEIPATEIRASSTRIDLREKDTVEFVFSTKPPTPNIPVCIQVSSNYVDWYDLSCGLTGEDGTFKATFEFTRSGTIYYRALWRWKNYVMREEGGVGVTAYASSPCIIATVAYGSEMAQEVVYMRYVRDELVGSTKLGKKLVKAWNSFYYAWSPTLASLADRSDALKAILRAVLMPLVGEVWIAEHAFYAIMPISPSLASIATFLIAAILAMATYIAAPSLLAYLVRKRINESSFFVSFVRKLLGKT